MYDAPIARVRNAGLMLRHSPGDASAPAVQ